MSNALVRYQPPSQTNILGDGAHPENMPDGRDGANHFRAPPQDPLAGRLGLAFKAVGAIVSGMEAAKAAAPVFLGIGEAYQGKMEPAALKRRATTRRDAEASHAETIRCMKEGARSAVLSLARTSA